MRQASKRASQYGTPGFSTLKLHFCLELMQWPHLNEPNLRGSRATRHRLWVSAHRVQRLTAWTPMAGSLRLSPLAFSFSVFNLCFAARAKSCKGSSGGSTSFCRTGSGTRAEVLGDWELGESVGEQWSSGDWGAMVMLMRGSALVRNNHAVMHR